MLVTTTVSQAMVFGRYNVSVTPQATNLAQAHHNTLEEAFV